jgi:pyridoxamine 5'-phosphate oxidase
MTKSQEWFNQLRISYEIGELNEGDLRHDPFEQFGLWLDEAILQQLPEPNAFVLSTVDAAQAASSRTVLLKSFSSDGFVFFSNYQSKKAQHLNLNPRVAMNFLWLPIHRQVIIEGSVEKLDRADSEEYFKTRPISSQLGAWTSPQSEEIESREILETRAKEFSEKYQDDIPMPDFWGGYLIKPHLIEFWQGRPSRLHDRFRYSKNENNTDWTLKRIAP